jgi:hypothetical protein
MTMPVVFEMPAPRINPGAATAKAPAQEIAKVIAKYAAMG